MQETYGLESNPTLPVHIQRRVSQEKENAYTLYWDFVVDATASMHTVFPAVYLAVSKFIQWIIKYEVTPMLGITVIRSLKQMEETEKIIMEPGCYFTKDTALFLKKLKNISFYGGAADGRESVDDALCHSFQKFPKDSINKAVMVFSDAYGKDEIKDLTKDPIGNLTMFCTEELSEEEFLVSICDFDGSVDEEGSPVFIELAELLQPLSAQFLDNIVKPVKDMIKGVSIGV